MTLPQISVLLEKYLKGEASDTEKLMVETWLKSRENTNNEWDQLDEEDRKRWLERLFMDVQRSIAGEADETDVPVLPKAGPTKRSWYGYAAASVAAAMLIVGFYSLLPRVQQNQSQQLARIETQAGTRKKVILKDGSKVWLGPKSELSLPASFPADMREVSLKGEAYFEVERDDARPFVVLAGGLETRVLGTAFNISSYEEDAETKVVLQSGTLQVMRQGAEPATAVRLSPNEMLVYNRATQDMSKTAAPDQLTVNSFKKGSLLFEQTAFSEVAKRISDAYGIRIKLSNTNLNNCQITGVFDLSQPIDELMKIVSISVSAEYSREGKTVLITGKGCP